MLDNLGSFLSLKDLLNTATLSKEYNLMLKKYLKDNFALNGNINQSEFQQLKSLLNRRLYTWNKQDNAPKMHPSSVVLRAISLQEKQSIVQTLDGKHKLAKTSHLLSEEPQEQLELTSLPMNFKIVRITDTGILYCTMDQIVHRYNLNEDMFAKSETIDVKGEVEDIIPGYRFAIAIVRVRPDEVQFRIFDNNEPLSTIGDVKTPFEMGGFKTEGNFVMGRFNCYFLHN